MLQVQGMVHVFYFSTDNGKSTEDMTKNISIVFNNALEQALEAKHGTKLTNEMYLAIRNGVQDGFRGQTGIPASKTHIERRSQENIHAIVHAEDAI